MPEESHDRFPPVNANEASIVLAHASKARTRADHAVREGSGWTERFFGSFGVATIVFISLVAVGGVVAYVASWVVYGIMATWFQRREMVTWRGFDRYGGRCFAAWFLLQGVGCGLGFNLFSGVVAYWMPVALIVSVPMFLGAWRAARR